jgi:hypothetical protein
MQELFPNVYGLPGANPRRIGEVAKLEKVQLESARIVTGLTKFASRDSLYYETGWEPLTCASIF